ncbi:MAG: DUF2189 domain-containing protein [Xanthomonadaceae bacterium]|nr:DUF2189 domain-containing protein [Xanthomonadaceae bacterium]
MTEQANQDRAFAAPCNRLAPGAAFGWLARGWRDYRAGLRVSLVYGLVVLAISLGVSLLAWKLGSYVLVISMLSGFIFLAPLLATGLYSVSRQIRRGRPVSFARSIKRMRLALRDALVFALVLLVIFLVWVRAGVMVHVFFPAGETHEWFALLRFLGIGSAVGSIFALVTFSAAAFSLPMIVDRDVDMITACVTSVNAVLRNKPAMAVWIAMIVLLTGLGFATAGFGLIVVIPLLGYATWHGYVETIDASAWPDSATPE